MARTKSPVRVRSEKLFLHKTLGENLVFDDVTPKVNHTLEQRRNIQGLVGMRISDKVVAIHNARVAKASASRILGVPLALPRQSFLVLETLALQLAGELPHSAESGIPNGMVLTSDNLVVKFEDSFYEFAKTSDDNNIISLSPKFDDVTFELPTRPVRMDFFFKSPVADRIIAVNFTGFLNRPPGEAETLTRAVLRAINTLLGLTDFSLLASINGTAKLPPPDAPPATVKRRQSDRVLFTLPVRFFNAEGTKVRGQGNVQMEVDLDNANQVTSRLLYKVVSADSEVGDILEDYRKTVVSAVDEAVQSRGLESAEQRDLALDIIIGDLSETAIDRIRSSVAGMPGIDVTSSEQWKYTDS